MSVLSIFLLALLGTGIWFAVWKPLLARREERYSVSGRISTHRGLDPSGFRIWIAAMSTTGGSLEMETLGDEQGKALETVTDSQGNFAISEVPAGVHWLAFKKKGLNTRMRLINMESGNITVELKLDMKIKS
ncbi:MAG: hypothetical protein CVV64_06775 [Candidatus Wallbacteria bacterium HGW-Wallbacteria-1]|jgi:hypothetical protein|uniref:Carboxypeptidase regulatory-like domain-containing protein n=1 Tax=Candidatus Wallbacteria bacterium HGW-Wallbacteria-1 TaxID=2013854 RepID=A0A2N1PSZ1_9BACT|nr:MAG: hypothetical protein CVV64_06775 [Candidatus Wallbacteria bacterium HGW-Wallbacteria-1]